MMEYTTRMVYSVRVRPDTFPALGKLAARLDITWGGRGNVSGLLDRLAERYDSKPDAVVDLLRYRSQDEMADYLPQDEEG